VLNIAEAAAREHDSNHGFERDEKRTKKMLPASELLAVLLGGSEFSAFCTCGLHNILCPRDCNMLLWRLRA
jgi:hypothetical protein